MTVLNMLGLNWSKKKYVVERRKLPMDRRYPRAGGENILVRELEMHLRNTALKVWTCGPGIVIQI